MLKFICRPVFNGLAVVLAVVALTNIGATSLFMMYQPEPPRKA